MVHPLTTLPRTEVGPVYDVKHVDLPAERRCDADAAERAVAIVYVTTDDGTDLDLAFCGHHLRAHANALLDTRYDIVALVPNVDSWPYTIGKRWEHTA